MVKIKKQHANAVQFLGFKVTENPAEAFALSNADFSHEPEWLRAVLAAGRLSLRPSVSNGNYVAELTYHASDSWHTVTVENGAWLINQGAGALRIVTNSDYLAVKSLSA